LIDAPQKKSAFNGQSLQPRAQGFVANSRKHEERSGDVLIAQRTMTPHVPDERPAFLERCRLMLYLPIGRGTDDDASTAFEI